MEITLKQYLKSKKVVEQYENQGRNKRNSIELRYTDLSVRVMDRLRFAGMDTIGDVREFFKKNTVTGFYKLRGIGKLSIDEIRRLLDMSHEDFYKS